MVQSSGIERGFRWPVKLLRAVRRYQYTTRTDEAQDPEVPCEFSPQPSTASSLRPEGCSPQHR
eukprot:5986215-Amphidinium_carterae.1